MGGKHSFAYYNQIQAYERDQAAKYNSDITCIIQPKNNKGGLYLGNVQAASNVQLLKHYGIASVLSIAIESKVHYGGIIPYHLIIQAHDIPSYDLKQHAQEAMKFIDTSLKKTNVLIHCMMGVSRSASLVIWYLMTRNNMTLAQAFQMVRQKRQIINPNKGFINQLKALEAEILQKKSKKSKINEQPVNQFPQVPNTNNHLKYSGVQIR